MRPFQLLAVFAFTLALSGCAANRTPASCDGAERRPVNAAKLYSAAHLSCGVTA